MIRVDSDTVRVTNRLTGRSVLLYLPVPTYLTGQPVSDASDTPARCSHSACSTSRCSRA